MGYKLHVFCTPDGPTFVISFSQIPRELPFRSRSARSLEVTPESDLHFVHAIATSSRKQEFV